MPDSEIYIDKPDGCEDVEPRSNPMMMSFFLTIGRSLDDTEELAQLIKLIEDVKVTRCVIGREVGESGYPHFQACGTLKKNMRWKALMALFKPWHDRHQSVRLAICRNVEGACIYCRKEGDVVFDFDGRQQGKRTDLDACVELFKAGKSLKQVAAVHPTSIIRYPGGMRLVSTLLCEPPVRDNVVFLWFSGESGSGKSRAATTYRTLIDGISYPPFRPTRAANGAGLWFDGYQGEDYIVLDDFTGGDWCDARTLVAILDPETKSLSIKGSTMVPKWHTVIVTSNYTIDSITDHPVPFNCKQWDTENIIIIKRRLRDFGRAWSAAPYPTFTGERAVYGSALLVPAGPAGGRLRSPPSSDADM